MDKARTRTNTPIREFLSRFRCSKHKSPALECPVVPDKDLSAVDTSDSQDNFVPALNSSSPGQSDAQHQEPSPGNPDREDLREGGSGKRSLSRFAGIEEAGKEKELLTYKRRPRIGGQKRNNPPEDRASGIPQKVRALETDDLDPFDQLPYYSGKVSGKPPLETQGFGRGEVLSRNKTWKRILGPQKTVALKRIGGQYFLDLGQSDFSYSTCPTCGLLFARGQENDEKVHKAFHKNYTQGIVFKGWQSERVASRIDDSGNRVIIVQAEDSHHQAKVREVMDVMELELGLTPGWLLQRTCKVYLFISSAKKIVGCLLAEPIKSAFRVVPAQSSESLGEGGEVGQKDVEKDPSISNDEPLSAPDGCSSQLDREVSELPTKNDKMGIREQGFNEGEHSLPPKLGQDPSSEHAVYTANASPMSLPSATMNSKESKSKVEGDLSRVKQEPVSVTDRSKAPKITDFFAPKARTVRSRPVCNPEGEDIDSKPHVKVEKDVESQAEVFVSGQNQRPNLRKPDNGEKASSSHVSEASNDKGRPLAVGSSRTLSVQDGDSREDRKRVAKTNVMVFGNVKFSREIASRKRASKELTQDLGSAILCTKTPVPAVCGVRVIWVSHTERRKGIASHLLDAMRKTFCLGVVLEPSQFAFSQPTPEGRRFAVRYCKTNEFLVYTTN